MINLNNELEKARSEFEQKNYEEALEYLENIDENDKYYDVSIIYRIYCLIHLSRYSEALSFLNPLIENFPYEFVLWYDKARCHILLHENEKAYSAMENIERIADSTDKEDLLHIARLYNLLDDGLKAIEYADKALEIDECYKEALYEKSLAASGLKDDKLMGEVSDRLFEVSDKSLFASLPSFLLKLFSKDYRGCLYILENCEVGELDDESLDMVKTVLYQNIADDLNAQLMLSKEMEISVDDAIKLMLDFKETGKDSGKIHGVQYFII